MYLNLSHVIEVPTNLFVSPYRQQWSGISVPVEGTRGSSPGRACHAAVCSGQLTPSREPRHIPT